MPVKNEQFQSFTVYTLNDKVKITRSIKILTLLIIINSSYKIETMAQTEKQKYSVLHKNGDLEIRRYDPTIMASVEMPGSYSSMSSTGFRELAGYIFGGNDEQMKIAMTAPVHVASTDSTSTMSFVMPSEYSMVELPDPLSEKIRLHKTGLSITASISFGGYASDKVIRNKTEELKALLRSRGIKTMNDYRFLGYNPPYRIINRRNEIVVTLFGNWTPDSPQ